MIFVVIKLQSFHAVMSNPQLLKHHKHPKYPQFGPKLVVGLPNFNRF